MSTWEPRSPAEETLLVNLGTEESCGARMFPREPRSPAELNISPGLFSRGAEMGGTRAGGINPGETPRSPGVTKFSGEILQLGKCVLPPPSKRRPSADCHPKRPNRGYDGGRFRDPF